MCGLGVNFPTSCHVHCCSSIALPCYWIILFSPFPTITFPFSDLGALQHSQLQNSFYFLKKLSLCVIPTSFGVLLFAPSLQTELLKADYCASQFKHYTSIPLLQETREAGMWVAQFYPHNYYVRKNK